MKRGIALLLAICLVLGLAACGGGTGPGPAGPTPGGIGGGEEGTLEQEGYVFVSEFIDLDIPGVGSWVQLVGMHGDTLYLVYGTELPDGGWGTTLSTIRTDGTGFNSVWTGRSESTEDGDRMTHTSQGIRALTIRADGGVVALRQNSSSFWSPDDWGWEENFYLVAFAPNGSIEREVDLSALLNLQEGMHFDANRVQVMSDGRTLLGGWNILYVLSPDWTSVTEMAWEDVDSFLVTRDDQVLVSARGPEDMQSRTWHFDLASGQILNQGDSVFDAPLHSAQTGAEFDLYIGTHIAVFGFDLEAGRSTQLFDWMDMDMLSSASFAVSDTGEIYFFDENFGGSARTTLIRLSLRHVSEVPQQTIITFGGLFVDWDIRREIVEFNRRNTQYRIRVVEYADWLSPDMTDAIRRLNTDIITGNAPDILDFGAILPFEQYARRGFLADIGAMIEADNELRGTLVDPIMDLLRLDGTLYTVMSQFSVGTLVGRTDRVGPNMGWTMDEFLAIADTLPEGATMFDRFVTQQAFLQGVLGANLGLFVDRETGRANFDSPLFMDYLNFAMSLQTEQDLWGPDGPGGGIMPRPMPMPAAEAAAETEYDAEYADETDGYEDTERRDEGIALPIPPPIGPPGEWESPFTTNRVLLQEQVIWGFTDLIWTEENFGGQVTFKGYPTEQGNGSVILPRGMIAISAGSRNQDAAWSFVRTLLTERWQEDNASSFPTNRAVFERRMAEAMELPRWFRENPDMIDPDFPPAVATQAQVDQIYALVMQTSMLAMRDTTVFSMIEEELLPFFAGDRSIQETVRIIQSRVQTYLSERA
ncbi:MAG: extracellular solute-binding protein [Oscillospiraceae bacterium]|nr:extracellular solute-binding protein [Oscillospiraceae bacterium]